ncbi:MAG TPA: sigma-54 dependent transcriptional regulator [Spirochaetota bacterium]|nr:sigma-54 dependent transcriptional regulator [Spirochaetota bacterium]HOL56244.1 sigma-54 dependent transcriptional regulator [Spirochaetota bacterium]HPP04151.1 sigma-54 dependent transcriptional regulator [Spirochaetota bacterium]
MQQKNYPENPIFIIDDEEHFLKSLSFFLKTEGFSNIITTNNPEDALLILKENMPSLILLDMIMPKINGEVLLEKIKEKLPEIPIIVITAIDKAEMAVSCIKKGAYDYLVKPIDETKLLLTIRHILELEKIKELNIDLKSKLIEKEYKINPIFSQIITQNQQMISIFKYIESISKTDLPILITGETGTGKELFANAIHKLSGRSGKFVRLNIASENSNIISDTLFGHSKGGFTGAVTSRKGLIETAEDGTLFLDEIGDLNIENQVKLLHILQERKYYQIGSDVEKVTNARFIFATNRDIEKLVNEGNFRKDLYYRLKYHHINIPPLRDRKDDIPLLVDHFLEKACKIFNKKKPFIPKEFYDILRNYDFPGNIRELESLVYDIMSRYEKGILSIKHLPEKLNLTISKLKEKNNNEEIFSLYIDENNQFNIKGEFPKLKELNDIITDIALRRTNNNQTLAAKLLGLSRKALNNRLLKKK